MSVRQIGAPQFTNTNDKLNKLKISSLKVKLYLMFFITSKFVHYLKNQDGVRIPCEIPDENGILTLIDKFLPGYHRLLVIANDPNDYTVNDSVAKLLAEAFVMTNKKFNEVNVLDNRTKNQTAELIQNADLIFMCGGEILRQLEFLKKIKFSYLIKNYTGVVVAVSAASMCLTKTICNFPEHEKELTQPRILQGLGIINLRLIPHFDGENLIYQGTTELPNLVQNYILPFSDKNEFYAIPNGSFIMYDGQIKKFFGPFSKIYKRKVVESVVNNVF